MIPVLTPVEMAEVDRAAPEPVETLVEWAGAGVARAARALMGAAYGRRVVVVAGKGNNGNDGRAAGRRLRSRGASVRVVDAGDLPAGGALPEADLVIDAAYGTGLGRPYQPPDPGGAPVLAVDIPSGLSGLTGETLGKGPPEGAMNAARTVTFGALKPGLLLGDGPQRCGRVEVEDIGLGGLAAERARMWLVTDDDVAALVPPRPRDGNKWKFAVQVVAGSPGMNGAAWMVSRSALRAGAGYVRLGMPGVDPAAASLPPSEVVTVALPARGWDEAVAAELGRFRALVVGPGLGPVADGEDGPVARLLVGAPPPAVVDADGLNALGSLDVVASVTARREQAMVLTPHAGEYARLAGGPPGADRIEAVRAAAARSGAVVLLKGSTTVVAAPDGRVLLAAAGSSRLATAGTGDVLSGIIGALLARGVPALEAAGLGAHVHGRAAGLGLPQGLVAGDLPDLVATWLSEHLP